MSSAGEWCLIESDPGVFSALIKDFGVLGIQVEEICSLDSDSFKDLKPVHGLIFLFKYDQDMKTEGTILDQTTQSDIFFAKQVISNACATQAIINILLNTKHKDVVLGSTLEDFRNFTQCFDASMRGLALSNSKVIQQVHNSFSRQQVFEYDEKATKSEDSYHFVGYVQVNGRVLELDGLKSGPVDHGPVEGDDWIETVRPIIQRRIQRYTSDEIHFNLMAVVGDKKMMLEKKIEKLTTLIDGYNDAMEEEEQRVPLAILMESLEQCKCLLNDETQKRQRNQVENIRRKHNYLPFIIEMIRILAAEEKLLPLIEHAKEKVKPQKLAQNL
ncbi:ubiquitin carboxyl-terminal hydrolase isozyme L5-like [Ciona intestinalis]|uniref:Ubiquitin carboxyl-terminal hydrolase n=1 Tax=Ciona intestinalis TaxID=7719 RepID=F6U019_CIOIN|nr:ubiquitin carboxyl-terminal hydrolase isozyme L5-like [Ciona intestinalis]|eukprot:XP_002119457.1 ubiquitin carboxyl-terminal hydrolase isozyme L5-like [Ciona intestinalis]